jgi:hypothetical protein
MHARKTKLPIDTLVFQNKVTKAMIGKATTAEASHEELGGGDSDNEEEAPGSAFGGITAAPASGVYIHGLFMEGARWDTERGHLAESEKGELFTALPVVWMEPVDSNTPKALNSYACPVYKESTRQGVLSTTGHSTNFVMHMHLKSPDRISPDRWQVRGAALLCQLDD